VLSCLCTSCLAFTFGRYIASLIYDVFLLCDILISTCVHIANIRSVMTLTLSRTCCHCPLGRIFGYNVSATECRVKELLDPKLCVVGQTQCKIAT
jgi:hypothetical protein